LLICTPMVALVPVAFALPYWYLNSPFSYRMIWKVYGVLVENWNTPFQDTTK